MPAPKLLVFRTPYVPEGCPLFREVMAQLSLTDADLKYPDYLDPSCQANELLYVGNLLEWADATLFVMSSVCYDINSIVRPVIEHVLGTKKFANRVMTISAASEDDPDVAPWILRKLKHVSTKFAGADDCAKAAKGFVESLK